MFWSPSAVIGGSEATQPKLESRCLSLISLPSQSAAQGVSWLQCPNKTISHPGTRGSVVAKEGMGVSIARVPHLEGCQGGAFWRPLEALGACGGHGGVNDEPQVPDALSTPLIRGDCRVRVQQDQALHDQVLWLRGLPVHSQGQK